MASTNDSKIRNITGASIEVGKPIGWLRRQDRLIEPIRIGDGPNAPRGYSDAHIERAKRLAAFDQK